VSLTRRVHTVLLLSLLTIGCIAQTGTNPSKPKPKPGGSSLSDITFESLQSRDRLRATKLRALKGTKYDGKRQEAISQAGAEASAESWKPVAAALAKRLDKISQTDQAAFDAVLEELAVASERAGK